MMHGDGTFDLEQIIAAIKSGSLGAAETRAGRISGRTAGSYAGLNDILAPLDGDGVAQYESASRAHMDTLRADAERQHQQVVAKSGERLAALTAAAAARRCDISAQPADTWEFIQPFLIWQSPGFGLDDATTEPGNNTAKFHFHTDDDGYGGPTVTFWFIWDNSRDVPIAVNLLGTIQTNGFVQAGANGGILGGGHCDIALDVNLGVEQPLHVAYQTQQVQGVVADSTDWFSNGNLEAAPISASAEVLCQGVVIPAHRSTEFFVSLRAGYYVHDGAVDIDFTSGQFQITCPGALVQQVR
jgi:hypothetical protein